MKLIDNINLKLKDELRDNLKFSSKLSVAVACFDENAMESVIKTIVKKKPLRAVFRDGGFKDSFSKINVGEIFKLLVPETRVKVI